jgi:hypothetical protein
VIAALHPEREAQTGIGIPLETGFILALSFGCTELGRQKRRTQAAG